MARQGTVQGVNPEVYALSTQMYGEDFQDFMHRGATQCSSFHAYMDLFCYQAPSSRYSCMSQIHLCTVLHLSVLLMTCGPPVTPALLRSACCCMEPCLGLLHRRALLRGLMRLDSLPWAMTEHMNSEFETCPACRRKQEGWGLPQQLLSFRTVNARTSASILQRPSRDGEAAQEYADPQMQAMAQVWAHPEDLPLYPVSPFFPHLFSERRLSRFCRRCSEVMSHSLSL